MNGQDEWVMERQHILLKWIDECMKLANVRAQYGGYLNSGDATAELVHILNGKAHKDKA